MKSPRLPPNRLSQLQTGRDELLVKAEAGETLFNACESGSRAEEAASEAYAAVRHELEEWDALNGQELARLKASGD